jgi:hypothetical protein
MPRRSGGPKFYVSLQRYYYSGLLMVEIVTGGRDHANPGEILGSRLCQRHGAGRTFSDPREAVTAAYNVAKQWKSELCAKGGLTKKQRKVYMSLGATGGMGIELEPMSLQECQEKADEIYEKLPKCAQCSGLLDEESYYDPEGIIEGKFCSESCIDTARDNFLKDQIILRVQEQMSDDPRIQVEGEWSCRLKGPYVTFRPTVGEVLTWEVDPKTYEIKTEEDEESDDE